MKRSWKFGIYTAVALALAVACSDDRLEPEPVDTAYFPLSAGSWITYQVDSTRYDDFNMVVHERSLQVREYSSGLFTDASGTERHRIVREYRDHAGQPWGAAGYDIWAASLEGSQAIRVEENQPYLKLAFPLRQGKQWDGNVYIDIDPAGPLGYLEGWDYRISSLDAPLSINGLDFDSTVTVIQQATGTLIDTVGAREIYARGLGLVFRELYVLETQCTACDPNDVPCITACQQSPWEDKAERGFIFRQQILDYGRF